MHAVASVHSHACMGVLPSPETRGMNTPPQHHIRHFRRAFGRKPNALPHQSENCMASRSAHGGGAAAGGMVLHSKKLECVLRSA